MAEAATSRREQARLIERYLRSLLTDEDREAVASAGYRPRSWDPDRVLATWNPLEPCREHERQRCYDCAPHRHPRHVPAWQDEVDTLTDRQADTFSLAVRLRVSAEVERLPRRERLIIRLHATEHYSFERVVFTLGQLSAEYRMTDTHAHRLYWTALERIAALIWPES